VLWPAFVVAILGVFGGRLVRSATVVQQGALKRRSARRARLQQTSALEPTGSA
jgi:hypothetical protein